MFYVWVTFLKIILWHYCKCVFVTNLFWIALNFAYDFLIFTLGSLNSKLKLIGTTPFWNYEKICCHNNGVGSCKTIICTMCIYFLIFSISYLFLEFFLCFYALRNKIAFIPHMYLWILGYIKWIYFLIKKILLIYFYSLLFFHTFSYFLWKIKLIWKNSTII